MKGKETFIEALETLLYSWGSDTPTEVYWGLNELLEWFEVEYNVKLNIRFDEETHNSEEVINKIKEVIGLKDYITKDEIRNLVEYCLNDIVPDLDHKKVNELIDRFDVEFRKAREYYRMMYKEDVKKCKTN